MERHTLPDAEFAALGAGRPSAATVAELRRAQTGRHLLLLREIARADPEPWYAAEHADPSGFRRRVADPLFGAWATHRLRSHSTGSPPGVGARSLTAGHDGLIIRVRLEDTDPARGLLGLPPTDRLTDAEADRWRRLLAGAWRILVTRHRPAAEVLASLLTCLVPVEADPADRGISATSADAFGAVAISAPRDATALAVGLLHEAQHSILNATTYLFDLLDAPRALGYSPWRDDPRPASGILHGAYAYLAVTRFWRTEAAATGDRLAAFEFARWREAVAGVAGRLLAGRGLTAAGRRFVTALRDEVEPWLTEPVDGGEHPADRTVSGPDADTCAEQSAEQMARAESGPDADTCAEQSVEQMARGANADHYLRWRLRNLRLDGADADALARAWLAGEKAPGVAARLVPAPRRTLESSARLDLIHGTLRGDPPPRPGGRATAGDVAFVRGDRGTAESAYLGRVLLAPQDDAAWAGLALVTDLGARPELVKAVAVRANSDPLAVARWIRAG